VRLADVHRIFEGLSIINFNYDRCVETFLYHADVTPVSHPAITRVLG
jgi:hypothetical protein